MPVGGGDKAQIDVPVSETSSAGTYHVSTDAIRSPGEMNVSVIAHRSGLPDAVLNILWKVFPSTPVAIRHPVFISSYPLAPILTLLSLSLCVLFGVAGLMVLKSNKLRWFENNTQKTL
jgi:hypothetical protein